MLKPVSIGGTTGQPRTLHNMDFIERLGVKLGDWVESNAAATSSAR